MEIGKTIVTCGDNENSRAIFYTGAYVAKTISKLKNSSEEEAKDLELTIEQTNFTNSNSNKLKPMYFHFRSIKNGCDPIKKGKIPNKPDQEFTLKEIFKINWSGSSTSNLNNQSILVIENRDIENDRNFKKIIQTIYKNKKWMIVSIVTSLGIYIIFKHKKFVKFVYTIYIYTIYKRIFSHWLLQNKLTKSILLFNRSLNRLYLLG